MAFAPGEPGDTLYDDWSLTLLGRVSERVSVGVSDLSVKLGPGRSTLQAGVRAMVRLYDGVARRNADRTAPRPWWVLAGGGVLMQGTSEQQRTDPLALGQRSEVRTRAYVGAVPYLQAEAHYFVLDRWSLGVVPRVALPLRTRFYPGGRQLPRYATTFELGAVLGVWL